MIKGDNLFWVWHKYTEKEREKIIKQICDILKIIFETKYSSKLKKLGVSLVFDWKKKLLTTINDHLKKLMFKKIFTISELKNIKKYISNNKKFLQENKMCLCYCDVHFDNFIVRNKKIVGILDLDGIGYKSNDYVLGFVKTMCTFPKTYTVEKYSMFVKKKDYRFIMKYFNKYYPQLFENKFIEKRINLYFLEILLRKITFIQDLKTIKEFKKEIFKIIGC